MKLTNDIARCDGVGGDEEGWREGCEHWIEPTNLNNNDQNNEINNM